MSDGPWREMTGKRTKLIRLAVATVFVLPLIVATSPFSSASPSKADVEQAKARIDQLNVQLEATVERYNQARLKLDDAKTHLAAAKRAMDQAKSQEDRARAALGERAVQAYTSMGTQVDAVLGAANFSEFSDRIEFMGALAQSDADLATAADTARQQAEWAAQQYNGAVADAQTQVDAVSSQRTQIMGLLDEAKTLYEQTNQDYQAALAAQRAAAQAQAAQDAAITTSTTSGDGGSTGGGGGYTDPPVGSGAGAAIAAAQAVIGAPYVFGSAGPDSFDCSGLTMWAWAHGGVSLPHSSAGQYSVLPHVSYSDVQPGDLLFFYSPISHVALYIGGGMMIHARHPGPGGEVQVGSVSGYGTPVVGVARP